MEFHYDIFLSYSSNDRDQAQTFAEHLKQEGFTVWWDRESIPTAVDYAKFIEMSISEARCLVVLWSTHSVESKWVVAEANEALDRQVLFPVIIEDCKVPMIFKHIQSINLINWDYNHSSVQFQKLVKDIRKQLNVSPPPPPPPSPPPKIPWIKIILGSIVVVSIIIWGANGFPPFNDGPNSKKEETRAIPAHCNNGIRDHNEIKVDCGGNCPPCKFEQGGEMPRP